MASMPRMEKAIVWLQTCLKHVNNAGAYCERADGCDVSGVRVLLNQAEDALRLAERRVQEAQELIQEAGRKAAGWRD